MSDNKYVSFADDSGKPASDSSLEIEDGWHLLVVDDDKEVHAVTRLALRNLVVLGKRIKIHSAYSAEEARHLLLSNITFAFALIDVVMETEKAGLELIRWIREDKKNAHIRLVLRTGQPGQAPERDVITNYDINDYKEKTELTANKLYTLTHACLRAYSDITGEQKMQQLLRRTQKMDAVGQLTGGIAHDFNNILGIILGNVEILQNKAINDEKITKKIESIRKSAVRGVDLVGQLLSFSGRQVASSHNVNLNSVISNMDQLIGRSVTPEVDVEHILADNLWETAIDSGDFESAVLNLVLNAHDAMEGSGKITIETCNCILDEGFCRTNPGAIEGEYVQLAISDSGSGIPPDVQERLFEPFFTTKEAGKGTGLGLAMVYGFVSRCSGYIKVYSELNIGTTFRIYLPRAEFGQEADLSEETEVRVAPKGNQTILVVDDETDLTEIARETLGNLGYKVLVAENGAQALAHLQNNSHVALMFSDVVMPGGMNGFQLAEQAHQLKPELKILLTSGFTSKAAISNGQMKFKANFLTKPYTQLDMAFQIGQLLAD